MLGLYNYTEILTSYSKYLIAGNAKRNTVKNYLSDIRHFFGWYQTYFMKSYYVLENRSFNNDGFILNPYFETYIHVIDTYEDYLSNSVVKTTKRRRLYSLKKFIQFCIQVKLIYSTFESKLLIHFEQLLSATQVSDLTINCKQTLKNNKVSGFVAF